MLQNDFLAEFHLSRLKIGNLQIQKIEIKKFLLKVKKTSVFVKHAYEWGKNITISRNYLMFDLINGQYCKIIFLTEFHLSLQKRMIDDLRTKIKNQKFLSEVKKILAFVKHYIRMGTTLICILCCCLHVQQCALNQNITICITFCIIRCINVWRIVKHRL